MGNWENLRKGALLKKVTRGGGHPVAPITEQYSPLKKSPPQTLIFCTKNWGGGGGPQNPKGGGAPFKKAKSVEGGTRKSAPPEIYPGYVTRILSRLFIYS